MTDNKKHIFLTVDPIIITDENKVLLIKRGEDPFKGYWAFPGGIVEYGESVETAVVREAKEETGLDIKVGKLTGIYSNPGRDPRGHSVSVCFLCEILGGEMKADTDASDVKFFKLDNLPELAFDHKKILEDALIVRNKRE